jgi:hypothetical protein
MTEYSSDFSTGLASVRSRKIHNLIEFIYYEAQRGVPLDSIKHQLRVAKGIFVYFLKMVINVMEFTHLQLNTNSACPIHVQE